MFKTLKNLYRKSVDVVTTVGSGIKSFFSSAFRNLKQEAIVVKEKVFEGEYLGKGGIVAGGTALTLASGSALAAVPASVTTAIADAVTDVGTVGGLVIGVVVIVFAFAMMRKPMNG